MKSLIWVGLEKKREKKKFPKLVKSSDKNEGKEKRKGCVCVPFLLLQRPIFILILKNKFHQSPFFSFLQPAKYKFSHLCLLSLFFSFTFSAVFFIQDLPHMAEPPTSPAGGSHESGGEQSPNTGGVREQDRYLPIANISRIMKKALPANGKIAKDAKDTVQECVSEFISFITSEASDKCQKEKRKTINGDDLLWAMATLGFEDYIDPLKSYLTRYRELECDAKGSSRGGDESSKRDAVGALPVQNSQQYMQTGALTYMTQGGQHLIIPSMQNNE